MLGCQIDRCLTISIESAPHYQLTSIRVMNNPYTIHFSFCSWTNEKVRGIQRRLENYHRVGMEKINPFFPSIIFSRLIQTSIYSLYPLRADESHAKDRRWFSESCSDCDYNNHLNPKPRETQTPEWQKDEMDGYKGSDFSVGNISMHWQISSIQFLSRKDTIIL